MIETWPKKPKIEKAFACESATGSGWKCAPRPAHLKLELAAVPYLS